MGMLDGKMMMVSPGERHLQPDLGDAAWFGWTGYGRTGEPRAASAPRDVGATFIALDPTRAKVPTHDPVEQARSK